VVLAEHGEGKVNPLTREVLGLALELSRLTGASIRIVVLGQDPEELARQIARDTGLEVTAIQVPGLTTYCAETYTAVLAEGLPVLNPGYVCLAHTNQGWEFSPALAVRLKAACITGVEQVSIQEGRICFGRSIYGGKILAGVSPTVDPVVITVQPGVFKAPDFSPAASGGVTVQTVHFEPSRSRPMGIKAPVDRDSALAEAEVIVSVGRGIGKKENLGLIYRLADLFPRSAVGGSRPVCDMGWLEYKRQVGLTGATVTPKLYFACGISGAAQHITGMRGSGFVVAVNTDPNAAIFNYADICIEADLLTFIPEFMAAAEKGQGNGG
jgi:electron transfer flavoprotein alpha subunit